MDIKNVLNQQVIFTSEECEKIISYKDTHVITISESNFEKFDMVSNYRIESGDKKYNAYLIEHNDDTTWVFHRLLEWFTSQTGIGINYNEITCGLVHNYKINDAFPKHIDRNHKFKRRVYNVGIQLNDSYDGGDYIMYINDEEYPIEKKAGNASYYKSDVWHEVKKLTGGERWAFLIHLYTEDLKESAIKSLI